MTEDLPNYSAIFEHYMVDSKINFICCHENMRIINVQFYF